MDDRLNIINRVIEEHHKIHSQLGATGRAGNDIEAIFNMQQAYAGWSQSSLDSLLAKQQQLKSVFAGLEEGLHNHFGYEEKYLPPILGEVLIRSLLIEHERIWKNINTVKTTLSAPFQTMTRDELFASKSQLQQQINDVTVAIETHAGREETMLNMAKEALEA